MSSKIVEMQSSVKKEIDWDLQVVEQIRTIDVRGKFRVTVEDFSKVCRTCLSRKDLTPIFNIKLEKRKGNNNAAIECLLKECAAIQATQTDELPQNICRACLTKLEKIHNFQKYCILNEVLLKTVLKEFIKHSDSRKCETKSVKEIVNSNEGTNDFSDSHDNEDSQEYSLKAYYELKSDLHENHLCKEENIQISTNGNSEVDTHEETLMISNHSIEEEAEEPFAFRLDKEVKEKINDGKNTVNQLSSDGNISRESGSSEDQLINSTDKSIMNQMNTSEKGKDEDCQNKSRRKLKEFKCEKCVLTFETREDYLIHRRVAKHTKNPLSNCEVCNKLFLRCKLKLHMRTHTKEKPYECKICLWKFNQKGNLERHMKKHDRVKPHVCQLCGRGFIHLESLENHKKFHEQKTVTSQIPSPKLVPRPSSYSFTCEFCGRFFKRKDPYNEHLRKHHSDRMKDEDPNNEKPHSCDICLKSFKDKQGLKVHKLTHGEKQELCNVCGKSFFTQSSLKTHLRIHTGERPYSCDICQKSFTNKTTLDSHMNAHNGVKPYGCEVCGKRFTQHQHLTAHSRTHTGERPFACSYCGRSFALKNTMRVHERTHTGETPYSCEICGKGFNDRSTRNKHRKHNHRGTDNKC